ncbi:MAG: hypothetical protein ACYDBW_03065 [Sulfuricaulis sp.]
MKRGQANTTGMTRSRRLVSLLALWAGWTTLAACSGGASSRDASSSPTNASSKIDPGLSITMQDSGSAQQELDVLIHTRGAIDVARRAALEGRGARIGSVIGDVVTARIPVAALSGVAALDFVVRIELSRRQRLR